MIRLTRRYRFPASHRLHSDALSEEANQELYGKCNNPYGHGHDYLLEVIAHGPVDEVSGIAVHVGDLDRLVEHQVLAGLRYSNLNDSVAFLKKVPTTENLVAEVDRRLRAGWSEAFPGPWPRLLGVRIQETQRNRFSSSEVGA